MKVELKVGAVAVSCETDFLPDPSGKCSENDAARNALFERLLAVVAEHMRKWMYEPKPEAGEGSPQPPSEGAIGLASRPATEQDMEAGKAKWCSDCIADCTLRNSDALVICEHFKRSEVAV